MAIHLPPWLNGPQLYAGKSIGLFASGAEGENRVPQWAILHDVLNVVGGLADEPTREEIREQLLDPYSRAGLLLQGIRRRVENALNIDWPALDEKDGFAELINTAKNHAQRHQKGLGGHRD